MVTEINIELFVPFMYSHTVNFFHFLVYVYFSAYECFHLYVHSLSHRSERLHVKLHLIGPLGVRVQCIDQSFCSAALTHSCPELRALKVQIAETI